MTKEITVEELVKIYDEDKSANKKDFFNRIKVEPYVSYFQKVSMAHRIVNATSLRDGQVELDSPTKYVIYCRAMIDMYTNIQITEKTESDVDDNAVGALMAAEFDALNSRGLIEKIFSIIPEKERTEFNTVIDMVSGDLMTNKYEPHAFVNDILARLMGVLNVLADAADNINVEELSKALGAIDEHQS